MRDGAYVPYTIETEGGPIEPELAACRVRLRADGWRLVAGRAERQDGGAVLRYLVLAAVYRLSASSIPRVWRELVDSLPGGWRRQLWPLITYAVLQGRRRER